MTTEAGTRVATAIGRQRSAIVTRDSYDDATDVTLTALLLLVTGLFMASSEPVVRSAGVLHGVLLALWIGLAVAMRRTSLRHRAPWVRPLVAVPMVLFLYSSIWKPAFAMLGSRDASLAALDGWLFGVPPPVLRLAPFATPALVEGFSFIYAWFIPLLYISIALGSYGRRREETAEFLFGFVLTYSIAYLGYLFVPAYGPVLFHSFGAPLPDGPFHRIVVSGIESLGGPHGAFPSLHVGATTYLCLYDLRRNRLRGLTLIPIVLGIAFATILLRYHYVVDLIAGLGIALVTSRLATLRRFDWDEMYPALQARQEGGLVRALLAPGLRTFFRKIEADGVGNVPRTGPVLFVANHVNGLVDPLVILSALPRGARLTAKSTLRENPLLALVFRAFGIIPFHRRQDSADRDPARNDQSIDACVAALASGGAILIFPEGVSHSGTKMRSLRSGAARIAARFQQSTGEALTLVPVALHFEAKEHYRSAVLVRFGASFEIAPGEGEEAVRVATGAIERRLRDETLEFDSRREELLFGSAAKMIEATADEPLPVDRERRLRDRIELTRRLQSAYEAARGSAPGRVAELVARIRSVHRELRRSDLGAEEVFLPASPARVGYFLLRELELLIFGLLPATAGLLQHGLPWLTSRAIARQFSSDRDHWASFAILSGMLIFPIFWMIEVTLIAWLWGWIAAVAFLIILPFTGLYAVLWSSRLSSAGRRSSAFVRLRMNTSMRESLRNEIEKIGQDVREIATAPPQSAPTEVR